MGFRLVVRFIELAVQFNITHTLVSTVMSLLPAVAW
jgi:hypothetical protein